MEKAALQSLRIALKAQILLCGSENDALRGPRVRFTDRHEISRSHPGVSTLQSIDTENVQPLIFLVRGDGASGRRALANDFDGVAFFKTKRRHGHARQPGKTSAAILRPRVRHLQLSDRKSTRLNSSH